MLNLKPLKPIALGLEGLLPTASLASNAQAYAVTSQEGIRCVEVDGREGLHAMCCPPQQGPTTEFAGGRRLVPSQRKTDFNLRRHEGVRQAISRLRSIGQPDDEG